MLAIMLSFKWFGFMMAVIMCVEVQSFNMFRHSSLPREKLQNVRTFINELRNVPIVGEDMSYIRDSFFRLISKSEQPIVSFQEFLVSEEIQSLLGDNLCTKDELEKIWGTVAGNIDNGIDLEGFINVNRRIDEMFEFDEDDADQDDDGESELQSDDVDIWSFDFQPQTVLEPEFFKYLNDFFVSKSVNGFLDFKSFSGWDDLKELMKRGDVDSSCLKDLWKEALEERKNEQGLVDFDTFVRLNIRLDETLDEIEAAVEGLTESDVATYCTEEFKVLSKGDSLIGLQQLLDWPDLVDLIADGVLEEDQVIRMWDALPKEALGTFYKGKGKGFGRPAQVQQELGINLESFLAFNRALDSQMRGQQDDA